MRCSGCKSRTRTIGDVKAGLCPSCLLRRSTGTDDEDEEGDA